MMKADLYISKSNFVHFRSEDILTFYQIIKVIDVGMQEIGKGAFGVVYKAKQKSTNGQIRAIKKIIKKQVKYPSHLKNQIQNLVQLDHPSILKIYELFQDEKHLYLVTDYCQGGELFDKLNQMGSFNQDDARIVFRQLIQALRYCNSKNIAHRDLKPENMLFLNSQSLNLKLIDFGFSCKWKKCMRQEIQQRKQSKLVGTAYYIAPEILKGNYDEKCDIWSAGVILYVMVTATPPFDGRNQKQILNNVKRGHYTMHIPQMKLVSQECKDLIKKMISPQKIRITIEQILNHPWMKLQELPKMPLKLDYGKMKQFGQYSKLKKITANFIASKFSQKNIQNLSNLFKQMDTDHDGAISIQQLKAGLQKQKQDQSYKRLKQILDGVDTDKNGLINYTEFVASAFEDAKLFTIENLSRVFKSIDKDKSGQVDKNELKQLLQQNNLSEIHGKQIDELMQQCDKNNDGKIDFNQFVANIVQ